ncbi:hypothetical protein GQ54DRAFT_248523, partial [Martensiomyces pterosporus]
KDRFNYASADCAAVVLKSNREARGLTAILNSKKDQYMLNECSAQGKFVIVELCDDILIDTLVLGNYEFFSSTFKDTLVYVSDRYPPKNNTWTMLGHFQAHNSRDAQVFPVVDPKIWARYVKIEFVTHYGREFYCPVTVLRVYGATQMEQYRKEEEEEELLETATLTIDALVGTQAYEYPEDSEDYEECDEDDEDCVYDSDDSDAVPQPDADGGSSRSQSNHRSSAASGDSAGVANKASSSHGRGQESIFKTIMRRLSRVERNITLAYHYLEEQHMVFNLVLQQVEANNLEHLQLAVKQLNHSTAKQMQSLTTLSEEVWRAILYDIEEYQQKTRSKMDEMAARLEFLAEEVLFEKRMNVAQLVLLLTIIVMVALNR